MQNPGENHPQPGVRTERPMHPAVAARETEGWGAKLKRFASEAVSFTAEKARHSMLGDVAANIERAGIRLMDRRAVNKTENAYQKVHGRTIKIDTKITAYNLKVTKLEDSLKQLDASVARQQGLGHLDSKTAVKAAKERATLEQRIEKDKAARDKAQVRLQKLNNVKAGFENKEKAIAEKVITRVDEKVRPFERRLEEFQPKREQLSLEIENFRGRREHFMTQAAALEAELKGAAFGFERDILKKTISEVQAELKKTDNYIESRMSARAKIEKRMSAAETRLEKWRTVSSEFGRITNRTRGYVAPGAREAVTPDFGRRGYSFDAPSAPAYPPAGGGPAAPGNEPGSFENINVTPNAYLALWNAHFGSDAKLSEIPSKNPFGLKPEDLEQSGSAYWLEEFLRQHFAKQRSAGELKLSKNETEKRLASMRQYISGNV